MKTSMILNVLLLAIPLFFAACGGTDNSEEIARAFDMEECDRISGFWDGSKCYNPCGNNPCGSHGTSCKNTGVEAYVCQCEDNYFSNGSKCVNPCDDSPCGDVTCKATGAETYDCKCDDGLFWNGSKCVNPCDENSCGSNGTCKATGAETYECKCDDGYSVNSNYKCADVDECSNPSLNNCPENSDCVNEEGSYSCICKENYSGDNCLPNKRMKECTNLPENAEWNSAAEIEQTWNGEGWSPTLKGEYSENEETKKCVFKCKDTYKWEDNICINKKTLDCDGLPIGAIWNTATSITQTWNGTEWVPSNQGTYNTTSSSYECRYKCDTNYTWDGSICKGNQKVANCTGLPAANAKWNTASTITQTWNGTDWAPTTAGVYSTEESTTECRFRCKNNFFYEPISSVCINPCDEDPCSEIANATGGCVATNWDEFSCECEDSYKWDETKCAPLPECGLDNITPCRDSSTKLVWSAKSSGTKTITNAIAYCDGLNEGEYTDWRVPNIDELRSLINGCSNTKVGGKCKVSLSGGCLSGLDRYCVGYGYGSDYSSSCGGDNCPCLCYCNDCGSTSAATISKFNDVESLWSSSVNSYSSSYRWGVNFTTGEVFSSYTSNSNTYYVRCVR